MPALGGGANPLMALLAILGQQGQAPQQNVPRATSGMTAAQPAPPLPAQAPPSMLELIENILKIKSDTNAAARLRQNNASLGGGGASPGRQTAPSQFNTLAPTALNKKLTEFAQAGNRNGLLQVKAAAEAQFSRATGPAAQQLRQIIVTANRRLSDMGSGR